MELSRLYLYCRSELNVKVSDASRRAKTREDTRDAESIFFLYSPGDQRVKTEPERISEENRLAMNCRCEMSRVTLIFRVSLTLEFKPVPTVTV